MNKIIMDFTAKSAEYRNTRFCFVCLWALIAAVSMHRSYAESLYVERLGLEDGLSQTTINAIVQDSRGFMWFATQTGLNRYDGYRFKIYGSIKDNPSSLRNHSVWALIVTKDGQLWVGTYGGLSVYRPETDDFISYQYEPDNSKSLSHDNIWALYEDDHGYIWVGTGMGLNRFDRQQQTFTRFLYAEGDENSISNNTVNAIFQDAAGDLWIGVDRGLNKYDYNKQHFHRINDKDPVLESSVVTSIAEDDQGRLWVGTDGNGLFILDKTRTEVERKTHDPKQRGSISIDKIKVLLKDSQQRLWIGTDNGGLDRFDDKNNKFVHYKHNPYDPHSLSEDVIYSLYEDRTGVFWIGTYTKGISKLNPYGFSLTLNLDHPTPQNPDPHTDIRAFLVDRYQALWVGSSNNGIRVTEENGEKQIFMHNPSDPYSISNDKVYSLFEDSGGTIWVGTANGWLNEYDRQRKRFIRHEIQPETPGSIRHGKVLSIKEEKSGLLWVGLERGAAHTFDKKTKKFTHYHHDPENPDSICGDRVFDLIVGRNDNIWFATFGGGLCEYNQATGKFTAYRHDQNNNASIGADYLSCLHEDLKADVIWMGVSGSGLNRFDMTSKVFQRFGTEQGLPDKNIYGIVQDDSGNLWLAHNQGMSRFNVKDKLFYNYEQEDGLQSNEFNGGAYYRAPDGRLFLGGIEGYNAFYADQIIDNPNKPPVYITDFQLFNKSVAVNEEYNGRVILPESITGLNTLTLSYRDSVFSFEFVGLDYAIPNKNQYAYRMEGLEGEWNYVDAKRRFATYTTLPPGDYTFRVKASNNNGIWNDAGTALAITITPPFWQTWWFRSLLLLVIMISIFSVYTIRVKAIRERNKILEEQVEARTLELKKEKMQLEATLKELNETKDALIEAAHKAGMADTAISVLHNIGNILNSVNISTALIKDTLDKSVINKFLKASDMLSSNKDNLLEFITKNPKGEKLLHFLIDLAAPCRMENEMLSENIARLKEKINAIENTVAAQQSLVEGRAGFVEEHNLKDIIENVLSLQAASINRHHIHIEKRYADDMPKVKAQKTKLVQILSELYKNAKESLDVSTNSGKELLIETKKDEHNAYIVIQDSGVGIDKEIIEKIFAHGFTTKEGAKGFGLHNCANFMTEMGGKLRVESDGPGKGAAFTLSFPLHAAKEQKSHAA